ncbi:MAG: hypothetical protein ABSC13_08860 [Dehalococcoidia bacterium]|jgi:hypothetical protein
MVAIPEEYIKSAVFICVKERRGAVEELVPKATAFWVSVALEGTQGRGHVAYFVTARHCLYEASAEGYEKIYLRFNLREESGYIEVPTRISDWVTSTSSDVAAIMFVPAHLPGGRRFQDFDIIAFNSDFFVGPGPEYEYTPREMEAGPPVRPRVGTEIYHIGLFTQQYGKEKNLPIARFGHIARMPSVIKLKDPDGTEYDTIAYLVEFHSWGGHSGSPVYFLEQRMLRMVAEDGKPIARPTTEIGWITGFLGIISGHYEIGKEGKTTGDMGTVETDLNSGIATVIPAEAVRLLLVRDDMVKQRAELKAEMESKIPTPANDFARAESDIEFIKTDFDTALQRTSRRVKPSKSARGKKRT